MNVLEMMPRKAELDVHVEQRQDLVGGIAAAVFDNPGRTYRYLLTRVWDPAAAPAVFVMLNPSTADALEDDMTIRRCNGFARREGAGGIVVVNLFALRSTDPRALVHHPDPVGPVNDAFVRQAVAGASLVIAAWGAGGIQHDRAETVTGMLARLKKPVQCLGKTSMGQPRHPLYVAGRVVLEPYEVVS